MSKYKSCYRTSLSMRSCIIQFLEKYFVSSSERGKMLQKTTANKQTNKTTMTNPIPYDLVCKGVCGVGAGGGVAHQKQIHKT